jgi:hypothetical protein
MNRQGHNFQASMRLSRYSGERQKKKILTFWKLLEKEKRAIVIFF